MGNTIHILFVFGRIVTATIRYLAEYLRSLLATALILMHILVS